MLQSVSQLLLALASAAQVAGISNPAVARWSQIAATLVRQGDIARAAIEDLTSQILAMVEEGRDPTDAEWDELADRSQAAHDVIQNWRPGQ